jgi:hypothetical protein
MGRRPAKPLKKINPPGRNWACCSLSLRPRVRASGTLPLLLANQPSLPFRIVRADQRIRIEVAGDEIQNDALFAAMRMFTPEGTAQTNAIPVLEVRRVQVREFDEGKTAGLLGIIFFLLFPSN